MLSKDGEALSKWNAAATWPKSSAAHERPDVSDFLRAKQPVTAPSSRSWGNPILFSSRTFAAHRPDKLLPACRCLFRRTIHDQVPQSDAKHEDSSCACIKTKLCVCPVNVSSRNVSCTAATEIHAQAQALAPALSGCQTFGCVDARVALRFSSFGVCSASMAKPRLGFQKSLSTRPARSCFAGRAIDRLLAGADRGYLLLDAVRGCAGSPIAGC